MAKDYYMGGTIPSELEQPARASRVGKVQAPAQDPGQPEDADAKVGKAEAGYQELSTGKEACGACGNFLGAGACAVVQGNVHPGGICSLYQRV